MKNYNSKVTFVPILYNTKIYFYKSETPRSERASSIVVVLLLGHILNKFNKNFRKSITL